MRFNILHTSIGYLNYSFNDEYGYRLVVDADDEIARFYRSLIPKWITAKPQKYRAHISVVRKEVPIALEHWGKHHGEEVEFQYSPVVHQSTVYFWLNCFSTRLQEVRLELGLPVDSPYTRPPEGFDKCWHLSIANRKETPNV